MSEGMHTQQLKRPARRVRLWPHVSWTLAARVAVSSWSEPVCSWSMAECSSTVIAT